MMKPDQYIKIFTVLILLISALTAEGQKKTSQRHSTAKKKSVKFITPTPIAPDHLKDELLQTPHHFIWEIDRDTSLPPNVLFREEMSIEADSVLIKQYTTKTDMHIYRKRNNVDGYENNMYALKLFRMPYKIYYETISIPDLKTKKVEDYELKRESGMITFDYLMHIKTKKKYENSMNQTVGTMDTDPGFLKR